MLLYTTTVSSLFYQFWICPSVLLRDVFNRCSLVQLKKGIGYRVMECQIFT